MHPLHLRARVRVGGFGWDEHVGASVAPEILVKGRVEVCHWV